MSRAVPEKQHAWITEMTNNYREYRKIRKMLSSMNDEINELMDAYASELVQKSSKGKRYLEY